jgi:predicted nucleic acid-binding protein
MAFVLDNSIAVRWFIKDQRTPYSDFVLSRMTLEDVHVPAIFCIELTSVLMKESNKGTLSTSAVDAFFLLLDEFDLHVAKANTDLQPLYKQAGKHRLSPADTTYLLLAMELGLPIATADIRMQEAALRAGIPLLTQPSP